MRTRWTTAAIAFLCIIGIASCAKHKAPTEPAKTVFVLIDYSESARQARQDYLDSFKKVSSRMRPGDHLFVWKISEKSEMETRPLIDEHFPLPEPAKNEFYRKQAEEKARREVEARLARIEKTMDSLLQLKDRLAMRTALMSSLHVAEKVFKSDKKDKSVLVIMSDMIEDSSGYNFERERLSDTRVSEILSREKERNRLTDLGSVKVYVTGARASSTEQLHTIQNFWLRYFKECGADLSKEHYGPTLITFDE